MSAALFVAKPLDGDRTEYISRRTGTRYIVSPDLIFSEYVNPDGFIAEAPGLICISGSKSELLSLIELADASY
jgi:hypothetical protein